MVNPIDISIIPLEERMELAKEWRDQGKPTDFATWLRRRLPERFEKPRGLLWCRRCVQWTKDNDTAWPCKNCGSVAVYPPTERELERFLDFAESQMEIIRLDSFNTDSIRE